MFFDFDFLRKSKSFLRKAARQLLYAAYPAPAAFMTGCGAKQISEEEHEAVRHVENSPPHKIGDALAGPETAVHHRAAAADVKAEPPAVGGVAASSARTSASVSGTHPVLQTGVDSKTAVSPPSGIALGSVQAGSRAQPGVVDALAGTRQLLPTAANQASGSIQRQALRAPGAPAVSLQRPQAAHAPPGPQSVTMPPGPQPVSVPPDPQPFAVPVLPPKPPSHPYLMMWVGREADSAYEPFFVTDDDAYHALASRSYLVGHDSDAASRYKHTRLAKNPGRKLPPDMAHGPDLSASETLLATSHDEMLATVRLHSSRVHNVTKLYPRKRARPTRDTLLEVDEEKETEACSGETNACGVAGDEVQADEHYITAVKSASKYNKSLGGDRKALQRWYLEDARQVDERSQKKPVPQQGPDDESSSTGDVKD